MSNEQKLLEEHETTAKYRQKTRMARTVLLGANSRNKHSNKLRTREQIRHESHEDSNLDEEFYYRKAHRLDANLRTKNRYRGLFRLCKNPRQAKQTLSNRQRFFIFFLSSKKSSRNQERTKD